MNSWPFGRRLAADLTCGVHCVLRLDGLHDFGDGDVKFGQLIRLYPETHRVLASAEDGDAGDSGDPRQAIIDIDVSVVCEEEIVIGSMG